MSGGAAEALALDERDAEPRAPMKRLGSTRKLAAFNNIRTQLTEQTRVLESRAEAAAGVATELHDYCRRRADLEHEYSRALDKLARAAQQRHKDQRHKREQWALTGAYSCWQTALENTRALSRDHSALGDLYGGRLATRLQRAADDALRLHRKCKDIVIERHEEVGGALAEAGAAGKAHLSAATEWRAAASKLRHAYDQRQRLAGADPPRVKKLKALDKELEKRRQRHSEARARALRARADYVLCLEAANATLHRYYLDDIADIMLCMEVGFEACVGRVLRTAAAADNARAQAICSAADALLGCVEALDSVSERQRFLDSHSQVFALPRRIAFQGTPPEQEDAEISSTLGEAAGPESEEAADNVGGELAARLAQLEASARTLRAECRENAKTLDAAEAELVQQMEGTDEQWDIRGLFAATGAAGAVAPSGGATPGVDDVTGDAPRKEQEDYYLNKFRSYVCSAGRLARLESKAAALRGRLLPALAPGRVPPLPPPEATTDVPYTPSHSRRCRGGGGGRGQFAAPLDEHLAATRRELPLVLTSCVRVISSYGIRHQGIFRVSGSQVEMQSLRAAFERGEDPLARVRDASDINSVAGLLKLYLRELRPPILPPHLLDRLLRIAAIQSDEEFVLCMREMVTALPRSSMLVLRYLFAFLAHLSEYSEDNMMDEWNLAICVGPTLLAAYAEGGGAQVTAQNLVNELVKRTIQKHSEVFPQHLAPHALYRKSQFSETDGDNEQEGEGSSCSGGDDNDPERTVDEPDANDDLSLYDDEEEEISDDGENGDWRDRDASRNQRCESAERRPSAATAQVAEPLRPPSPPERKSSVTPASCRLAEATPDLVLDLPARAAVAGVTPPSPAVPPAVPTAAPALPPADTEPSGTADTFLHNRDTLKKRPRHKQTSSGDSGAEACGADEDEKASDAPATAAAGSPVPARNTARVAAKFAELTLTGGSLKPALAAKPALLRRPTPHPHHAASAPTPAPAPTPITAPPPTQDPPA